MEKDSVSLSTIMQSSSQEKENENEKEHTMSSASASRTPVTRRSRSYVWKAAFGWPPRNSRIAVRVLGHLQINIFNYMSIIDIDNAPGRLPWGGRRGTATSRCVSRGTSTWILATLPFLIQMRVIYPSVHVIVCLWRCMLLRNSPSRLQIWC